MFSCDSIFSREICIFIDIHCSHLVRERLSGYKDIWSSINNGFLLGDTIFFANNLWTRIIKYFLSFRLYGRNLRRFQSFVIECTREFFVCLGVFNTLPESLFVSEIFLEELLFASLTCEVHLCQSNRFFFGISILCYDRACISRKFIIYHELRTSFPTHDWFADLSKVIGNPISSGFT